MPWDQIELSPRRGTLEHYKTMTRVRRENPGFALGEFETVYAKGQVFAFMRELEAGGA